MLHLMQIWWSYCFKNPIFQLVHTYVNKESADLGLIFQISKICSNQSSRMAILHIWFKFGWISFVGTPQNLWLQGTKENRIKVLNSQGNSNLRLSIDPLGYNTWLDQIGVKSINKKMNYVVLYLLKIPSNEQNPLRVFAKVWEYEIY